MFSIRVIGFRTVDVCFWWKCSISLEESCDVRVGSIDILVFLFRCVCTPELVVHLQKWHYRDINYEWLTLTELRTLTSHCNSSGGRVVPIMMMDDVCLFVGGDDDAIVLQKCVWGGKGCKSFILELSRGGNWQLKHLLLYTCHVNMYQHLKVDEHTIQSSAIWVFQ